MHPCISIRGFVRPLVRPSVRWSIEVNQSKLNSGKTSVLDAFCVHVCEGSWVERWVWKGVGRPCPPVCNDIVIPRHLFILHFPKCQVRVCTLHKGGDARPCLYFVTDIRTSNSLHIHLSFQHLEKNWRKNK